MPEFGFPAQPRFAFMARTISDLRDRADDSRIAAVTGRFADVTTERSGRVSELMQLEKSIKDLSSYGETISLTEARASAMQESLGILTSVGQELADTTALLFTNGTDANFRNVSGQAASNLQSMLNALNVDVAGRALFAGDDAGGAALADAATFTTNAVPILEAAPDAATAYANLTTAFEGAGGLFDTTFYTGGAGRAPLTEVAQGERVDYTVKADETPMRRALMNTLVIAAAYDDSNTIPDEQRRELVRLGSEGLRSAIGGVIDVQSRLGIAEGRVASIKARNIATEAALTIQFNELAGADTYAAALSLTELERQLETAFATTARLSNLSLANYL